MYENVFDSGRLVFQNLCQGLASPEWQKLAAFPAAFRPRWHSPSNARAQSDPDSQPGAWVQQHQRFISFCFLIPSSQGVLGHCIEEAPQKPVPK